MFSHINVFCSSTYSSAIEKYDELFVIIVLVWSRQTLPRNLLKLGIILYYDTL